MEQRISIITLAVRDLKQSRAFYDALGWKIANEGQEAEKIVAYDLIAMTLCLYPRENLANDAGIALPEQPYSSTTIAYNVASEEAVEQTLLAAQKAGGTLIKAGEKAFWGGYSGYFADPDGNLWEVAFNPFAPLGPKGEFRWSGYPPP